jgi:hypothetical protein
MEHGIRMEDVWSQEDFTTSALSSEPIMTHLSTDIRVLIAQYNLHLDIIGGQRYVKMSTITSKDVPIVNETKSTPILSAHRYNPFIQNPKRYHSR